MENMAAGDEWIRDGGRVCLDFVNTLRDRWSVPRETLREPADLVRWLHGSELLTAEAAERTPPSALFLARRLREAIDRALLTAAGGGLPLSDDIALINEVAAAAPRPTPRIEIAGDRLVSTSTTAPINDVFAGLGLITLDAVDLLVSADVRHVRVCGADRCGLRFLDRSPAHNRRWCSMARCGNRTKVKRHQTRSAAAT